MTSTHSSEYRQVAHTIRERIADGTYARGSKLPTEDELAAELNYNRATVNRALRQLGSEGLVRVHRGKGTFVMELPIITRDAGNRYSRANREHNGNRGAFATEVAAKTGRTPRADVTVDRVQPPIEAADVLGIDPDTVSAVRRHRLMYAGDIPLQVAVSYIPLDIAAGTPIETPDSGPGGIISRMTELGHEQVRATEDVIARPPTDEEAAFLRMTPDQRVFEVTHIGWTEDDRAVEYTIHVYPVHQYVLHYDIPMR